MRLALVASSFLPRLGVLERHVHELAVGLTARGVEVEVLAQETRGWLPSVSEFDGFVVRRFAASFGNTQFAVAPGLWDYLRRTAGSFDVVHVHSGHAPFALAAARARPRRLVFTPHLPAERLIRRPYGQVIRALIGHGAHILCTATAESDVIHGTFPLAANQIWAVPHGVDIAAIESARPFAYPGAVVLAIGCLQRHERIDRAIAAMAALDPAYRLAVVGDGPAREKLLAHAADLRVSSRVNFVGAVADAEVYRWMRTARVFVALAQQESSGVHLTEALCAGAQVVASEIPVHREAARRVTGARVAFVSPTGSPLDVADAISHAARLEAPGTSPLALPSWAETVEHTLAIYTAAAHGLRRTMVAGS
jgi:glycosyltransferase involved in cell wall biosynthesis